MRLWQRSIQWQLILSMGAALLTSILIVVGIYSAVVNRLTERDLIGDVLATSERLRTAVGQVARVVENTAGRAGQQQEMTVQEIARNASNAAQSSHSARDEAQSGAVFTVIAPQHQNQIAEVEGQGDQHRVLLLPIQRHYRQARQVEQGQCQQGAATAHGEVEGHCRAEGHRRQGGDHFRVIVGIAVQCQGVGLAPAQCRQQNQPPVVIQPALQALGAIQPVGTVQQARGQQCGEQHAPDNPAGDHLGRCRTEYPGQQPGEKKPPKRVRMWVSSTSRHRAKVLGWRGTSASVISFGLPPLAATSGPSQATSEPSPGGL